MKFTGQAEQAAENIIAAFENQNIPAALSQVFIRRNDDVPCRSWSWNNQFLTALIGRTSDARGYKQWQESGRQVKKGAKSFSILGPMKIKKNTVDPASGNEVEQMILIGFYSIPVFRIEDTEIVNPDVWAEHTKTDEENLSFMQSLPFVDVAELWDLKINTFNGSSRSYLGFYQPGQQIAVGVKNLSTWAHELIHAADHKNNTLVHGAGQIQSNEIVAEFGGAVLLTLIGKNYDADLGGAWSYIKSYSNNDKDKALKLCLNLLDRTCKAVDKVLSEAERLQAGNLVKIAA